MLWTDEKISDLKRLWAEGLPAGDIGIALGFSKNAIIGKARREKLTPRRVGAPRSVKVKNTDHLVDWPERERVLLQVRACGGTLQRAANELGIEYRTAVGSARILGIKFGHRGSGAPAGARKRVGAPSDRCSLRGVSQPPLRRGELEPSLAKYEAWRRKGGAFTLLDLPPCHCKWPLGAPIDKPEFYCGEKFGPHVAAAGPYCERHQFQAVAPERRWRLFGYAVAAE